MNICKFKIFYLFLIISSSANSIIINNNIFKKYGGDINHSQATYRGPYGILKNISLDPGYLAVGHVYNGEKAWCTGTWLGNTPDGKHITVLTSARCVKYNRAQSGRTWIIFLAYNGPIIGESGYYYILPKRMNMKPNSPEEDLSTDIAILILRRKQDILDQQGRPIDQPILNDVDMTEEERSRPVYFIGNGYWGTSKDGTQRQWNSDKGSRRVWGQSTIRKDYINKGYMVTSFSDEGEADWARAAEGDNGMPWFQEETDGRRRKLLMGVGIGYGGPGSYATSVAPHKEWISLMAPRTKWRSRSAACWWLGNTDGKWEWKDDYQSRYTSEESCQGVDKCKKGGACYKWSTYP